MKRDNSGYYAVDEDAVLTDDEDDDHDADTSHPDHVMLDGGEESWRNKEGERLADFGVDEVAEFYDEDNMPLSELMRRRKEAKST